MVKFLKRLAAAAVVLAAGYFLFLRIRDLFDFPHLYLDLSRIGLTNVAFLGGGLLALALAVVAGIYLFFNADGKILEILIALVCCLALGAGSYFCLERALRTIPCTYTTSLAAYEEDFSPEEFRSGDLLLYPNKQRGVVNGYAYYENGDVRVRRVTALFEVKRYYKKEVSRLEELDLDAFSVENQTFYTLRAGDVVWQMIVDADTMEITYARYDNADQLPGFLPGIMTEPVPEETAEPEDTPAETDTEITAEPETTVPASSTEETDQA